MTEPEPNNDKKRASVLKTALQTPFLRNILLLSLGVTLIVPLFDLLVGYRQYERLLIHFTEDDAARVAAHLSPSLRKEGKTLSRETLPEGYIDEILEIKRDFGLEKVKLFSRKGVVVYSTSAKDMGKLNQHDYFHNQVAKGQVYTKVVRKEAQTAEGVTATADVVETYQPIMRDGDFLGAFELYYDITARRSALDRLLQRTSLQVVLMSLVIVAALLFVLFRAARVVLERDRAQIEIKEKEQKYRTMAASAQDAIIEMDSRGHIAFWNGAAERIFGFSQQEALGQDLHRMIAPQRFQAAFQAHFAHFQKKGEGNLVGKTVEMVGLSKAAQDEIPLEISLAAVKGEQGYRAVAIIRDIRDRKVAEQRLKLGSSVINHASQGIIVTNARSEIEMVNPAFTHLTGYEEDEVIGKDPKILRSGRHDPEFYESMWQSLLEKGYWQGEIWNRRKNGETYPEWLSLSAIRGSGEEISNFVAMFSDISKLKEAEEDLERLAFYDPLTALANRVLFRERLEQALREAKRAEGRKTAVIYLDLDHFKAVNDTHGHPTGDLLLQEAAKRLLEAVREVDTVARLGGDEFVIVLTLIPDESVATHIAAKVITSLNAPFYPNGITCHVGTSIGIAIAPQHGDDVVSLLKLADDAMYVAKKGGRNRYHMSGD